LSFGASCGEAKDRNEPKVLDVVLRMNVCCFYIATASSYSETATLCLCRLRRLAPKMRTPGIMRIPLM